jgi:hypothetical protein
MTGIMCAITRLRSRSSIVSPALSQAINWRVLRNWLRVIERIKRNFHWTYRQSGPMREYNLRVSPTTISSWLQISQGLLTPVIALITVYIAWQQWKLNKQKYGLDTYERKLRIYQRVVEMLRLIMTNAKPEIQDILKFGVDTTEADFLFPDEISEYINEIYSHAAKLHAARVQIQIDSPDFRDELTQEEKWFLGQSDVAKKRFKKHLKISG